MRGEGLEFGPKFFKLHQENVRVIGLCRPTYRRLLGELTRNKLLHVNLEIQKKEGLITPDNDGALFWRTFQFPNLVLLVGFGRPSWSPLLP